MKIKYLESLVQNANVFSMIHEPLNGCTINELELIVRYYNCHVPISYLELMYLGGHNFFGMVNAPNYGFGYKNAQTLQDQLKLVLMSVNRYVGGEIALCCMDDYFWFIYCDDGNDPPIRYYSEDTGGIEILYESISEMVKEMIIEYKKFYNVQS
jgi:hypothetical protein